MSTRKRKGTDTTTHKARSRKTDGNVVDPCEHKEGVSPDLIEHTTLSPEGALARISFDVSLLTKRQIVELRKTISNRIASFDAANIESEVEKNGFCVADQGSISKYTSIHTFVGVKRNAEELLPPHYCSL